MESVTDGDTLVVIFDGRSEPLRLIGINAPESGECFSSEATSFVANLVADRRVTLISDVSDRDQHGRLLRYVWIGDLFVNEALVRGGFAIASRYPPDLTFADVFDHAQADAQQAHVGVWAPDACGPTVAAHVSITHIEYDAVGDDSINLNGEWVELRNADSVPVDLSGWLLRDESSSHRYPFPTGFELPAGKTVTVYSGCGPDGPTALYWCTDGSAIWNNDGDTALLLDPSGNIVTSLSYTG